MPTYKLTYFDGRGIAEPARYLFELAGVKYEDVRIPLGSSQWTELKSKIILGQLPLLVVDGKEIPQSKAIYRYIGRIYGFYPSDPFEAAQVDAIVDTVADFDPDLDKLFESDDSEKEELINKFMKEIAPRRISDLEKLLLRNEEGQGWFVGDKISVADPVVFSLLYDTLPVLTDSEVGGFDLNDYPSLKGFVDRFKSEKKILEWIKKRPASWF